MVSLLLPLLLMAQGAPQAGTVTGVLKSSDGKPLPGIRMAAVAKPDSLIDALAGAAMSSIAETDLEGRYKLENIPPGRYYIAAGRLDLQTYYPGTPDISLAKEVAVAAGFTISDMDFEMDDASFGRAEPTLGLGVPNASIPIRVTVEGGGPLPVSGSGAMTSVVFNDGFVRRVLLTAGAINLPGPTSTAYAVAVQNLPQSYVVKSMTYGSTDLLTGKLQLTPSNFPPTGVSAVSLQLGIVRAVVPAYTPPDAVSIVLARVPSTSTTGVRVSGRAQNPGARFVHLSGIAGDYYDDGTFEVHGVPPGLHVIATGNILIGPQAQTASSTLPQAASVVVGTENLDGVVLVDAAMVPESVYVLSEPRPAGNRPPGVVPLARLSGKVIEEVSRLPIREGRVVLKVDRGVSMSIPITTEGGFEFPPLLPGTYHLEVNVFGHAFVRESIELGSTDIKLDVASRKF
jgi:hypothetical protein